MKGGGKPLGRMASIRKAAQTCDYTLLRCAGGWPLGACLLGRPGQAKAESYNKEGTSMGTRPIDEWRASQVSERECHWPALMRKGHTFVSHVHLTQ